MYRATCICATPLLKLTNRFRKMKRIDYQSCDGGKSFLGFLIIPKRWISRGYRTRPFNYAPFFEIQLAQNVPQSIYHPFILNISSLCSWKRSTEGAGTDTTSKISIVCSLIFAASLSINTGNETKLHQKWWRQYKLLSSGRLINWWEKSRKYISVDYQYRTVYR